MRSLTTLVLLQLLLVCLPAPAAPSLPQVKLKLKAGEKVVVAEPAGTDLNRVRFHLDTVVSSKGGKVVTKTAKAPIPAAYVWQLKRPAGLTAGSPVQFYDDRMLDFRHGIVSSITGNKAVVQASLGGKIEKVTMPLDRLVLLNGKAWMGQPVAYRSKNLRGPCWKMARLVCRSQNTSWLSDKFGKIQAVPNSTTRILKPEKFKKGDKVWAVFTDTFEPAIITAVKSGGQIYSVTYVKISKAKSNDVEFVQVVRKL